MAAEWSPRLRASRRSLPSWLQLQDDRSLVERCAAAFEDVWARAIPHEEYEIQ
ncbi:MULTISPECIES: DUF6879 family protein [unclassified Streptomyces]|uniref:DUF6879 family protein n=1 Tax=unclassified Streptomyces TaxID=2593676 RepID=UPI0013DE4AC5|nr:DUF6879 family protein [Streptomyces sp. CNQ-509]